MSNDIPAGTRVGEKKREGRDRFQAFSIPCETPEATSLLVKDLIRACHLRKATHISWALRLKNGDSLREVKDDGGESGSGNCILETLRMKNRTGLLVIVARWYGGKHLGGLRFRIYRRLSAEILEG